MSRAAGLGDDTLELVDLLLGTAEGTELRSGVLAYLTFRCFFACRLRLSGTYSLLGELAGALVTAVAQEFDDATLVGGEARRRSSLAACPQ